MKKTIAVLTLCAAISCAACSCGGKSSDSSSEASTKAAATEAANEEKSSGQAEASAEEESSEAKKTDYSTPAEGLLLATSGALMDFYYQDGIDVSGKYAICSDPSKNFGLEKILEKVGEDKLYDAIKTRCNRIPYDDRLSYVIYCENGAVLDSAVASSFDSNDAAEAGEKATGKESLAEIYAFFNN